MHALIVTLFARPTGFYYRKYDVTLSNNQGTYAGTLDFFCEHDIEQNASPDDAIVVCRKEMDVQYITSSDLARTEIEATTIGNAVPIATITNPPEGGEELPTLGLEPSGFSTIVVKEPTAEGDGDSAATQGIRIGWVALVVSTVTSILAYYLL
jgi:hypothetical protein